MHRLAKSVGIAVFFVTLAASSTATLAMSNGWSEGDGDKMKQAVSAVEKKDYVGAINLLKDVLASDAKNADALNYMGYSYRKLGNYDRAMMYYEKALSVKPDHKGANEYLGEAYLELKKPEKAKARLDRLAEICGTSCKEYQALKKAFDAYRMKGKQS